ncbi:MAG TPA: hypothetical protein DEQ61_19235 [Streptomyces sp.]|nr:hypothetical protein [Streptomyces sp.]
MDRCVRRGCAHRWAGRSVEGAGRAPRAARGARVDRPARAAGWKARRAGGLRGAADVPSPVSRGRRVRGCPGRRGGPRSARPGRPRRDRVRTPA